VNHVAVRLAAFAVVLATAFGGGFALGTATDDDTPDPVHPVHPVHETHETHETHDTQHGEQP
jgi:hypothetical protein